MARADSTVRVNIIGDAKSLTKATGQAEGSFKGIGKQAKIAGGLIAGAFAVDKVLNFGQAALGEADRVGDAVTRLETQLGDLSQPIEDAAESLTHLGLSEGDVLDLASAFSDVATASELSDENISKFAIGATEAAGALALLGDADAETIMANIGKAANGSERAMRALGISVTDAEIVTRALADTGKTSADQLTESEKAAAAYSLVLEKLEPRVTAITEGEADLEQQQAAVQAKFETLTGKIGEALEGPLNDLLSFILAGIAGWEMFAAELDKNEQKIREMLTPLARLADALGLVIGLFQELNKLDPGKLFAPSQTPGAFGNGFRPSGGTGPAYPTSTTINVQGGSPEAIEQAVRNAAYTISKHG